MKFQANTCNRSGDMNLHTKTLPVFSKYKKGDNSVKIDVRVMGLEGMTLSIDPEDKCEVSSQYLL